MQRHTGAILALLLSMTLAPGMAQAKEPDASRCPGPLHASSRDPDQRIRDCTRYFLTSGGAFRDLYAVFSNRARGFYDKGAYDQALADMNTALRFGYDADGYALRGKIHLVRKEYDLALPDFARSLRHRPNHAFALSGQMEAKAEIARGAVQKPLAVEQAWRECSAAKAQASVNACAIVIASRQVATLDSLAEVHAASGRAYAVMGEADFAIVDYSLALAIRPSETDFINRGHAYYAKKIYEGAGANYDAALKTNPQSFDSLTARARAQFQSGNYSSAVSDASQALALDGKQHGARYIRGVAKLKSGDAAGGNADIAAAKAADPNVAATYADVRP